MAIIKGLAKQTVVGVVSLACGLVMYGAMKNTRPSSLQHANAVTDVVEKIVDDIFQNRIVFPEKSREMAGYISGSVVPNAVDKLTNGKIDLQDFWIFNLGSVTDEEGNEELVSLGGFGKVFTFNEDKIRQDIEEMVQSDMKEFMKSNDNGLGVECGGETTEDSIEDGDIVTVKKAPSHKK